MGDFNKFEKRRGGRSFGSGGGNFGGGHKFGGHGGGPRPMFQATCSKCWQSCEVPFKPTSERPVFCSNCFKNQGNAGAGPKFAPKSFGNDNRGGNFGGGNSGGSNVSFTPGGTVTKAQFDSLNAKLDRIISLLGVTGPVEASKVKQLDMKEIIKKVKMSAKKTKSKRK